MGVRSVIEEFNFIGDTGRNDVRLFCRIFCWRNTIPKLVGKVGHIRVFAAFASMASLSILIHAVFVNPIIWTLGKIYYWI